MAKTILCSDSTCDLSQELIKKYDIKIIPLQITFGEESFKDGEDINTPQLYEEVEKRQMLPKTAAVAPGSFVEFFEKLVGEEGNDVVFISISSKLSSSFSNANLAKQIMDEEKAKHVYLADSYNLSTGIGLLVMKAAKFIEEGLAPQEIIDKINELVPCVRAQFSVKTLDYLHKGGRCSTLEKYLGLIMRIRPILRVIEGKILSNDKVFGKYSKALEFQIEDLVNNIDNIDLDNLFITHSIADEEADFIFNTIPEKIKEKFKNIFITKAGSVISSHCGKGTIGILYIKKCKVC